MRRLVKQWANEKPFNRRVRWYEDDRNTNPIRLQFIDSNGTANIFYNSMESAKFDWEQFKLGKMDTIDLRQGR